MARRPYVAPDEAVVPEQPLTTPKREESKKAKQLELGDEEGSAWLERVVKTIVNIDPEAEAERLRLELRLSASGSEVGMAELFDALDRVQDNAAMASSLYVHAASTATSAEVDLRIIESTLRERAREDLENEKASGDRKKQITEKDIQSHMDTHFTEEVRELEVKREANKRVVEHFEFMAKLWRDRARTLEALSQGKSRRAALDD